MNNGHVKASDAAAASLNISAIAIRRPVSTIMLMLTLIVLGIMSYRTMETDLFPDVEFPFVVVVVAYPGAGPMEIEAGIVKPIEEAVSSVNGIKHIRSTITSGGGSLGIEFELGVDLQDVASQVREKVSLIRPQLPKQIEEPIIFRFNPASEPVISYALSGPLPPRELTRLLQDRIEPALQQIQGVGSVHVFGATEREIQVQLLADRLQAVGLTVPQVVNAVGKEGTDLPSGYVQEPRHELNVRVLKAFSTLPQLAQLSVGTLNGQVVRLGDVARIVDGHKERRTDGRMNGKPAVLFSVVKRSGANTVAVVDAVKARLAELQQQLPRGVEIKVGRDSAQFIHESIEATVDSLVLGSILASLVIYAFLRSWRATVIATLAIPVSVIATFGPMKYMGFSLNIMSTLALALVVGILVDDAVVDLENIYRHMEEGSDPYKAALEATDEIWLAVLATTMTIVAVFVPVGFMGGFVGQFFKEFGLTVAFAVLFSLLVARTLTPTLAALFLRVTPRSPAPVPAADGHAPVSVLLHAQPGFPPLAWLRDLATRWIAGGKDRYLDILAWALDHRWRTLGLAVLAFVLSLPLMALLPKGFMSPADQGELNIQVKLAPGTPLAETGRVIYAIEDITRRHPEVTTTFATVGKRDGSTDAGLIGVKLVDKSERSISTDELKTRLREEVKAIPGAQIGFIDIGLIGGEESDEARPVKLNVYGDDIDELNRYAALIADRVKHTPRMLEIDTSTSGSKPELQLRVDRARAASLGVDSEVLATTLRLATIGLVPAHYQEGDKEIDIRVQLIERDRVQLEKLRHLMLLGIGGRQIPLSAVASARMTSGPTRMHRIDRQRAVLIWANTLPGTALGNVIPLIEQAIAELKLPPSIRYEFVGEAERMKDTTDNMALALGLSFVFIYIVLASQFESFIHPLTIMVSMPLSFVGAFLAMFVANELFGLMGMIGIVMLMGLVTKNAILLVDYTIHARRERGLDQRAALLEAGAVRLRPILMTTAAMILGMLPIALGIGAASEWRSGMGTAVIGGLITSTLLTLIVVPVIYTLFEDLQDWAGRIVMSRP